MQAIVNNQASNHGIVIQPIIIPNPPSSAFWISDIHSAHATNTSVRPELIVTYSPPAPQNYDIAANVQEPGISCSNLGSEINAIQLFKNGNLYDQINPNSCNHTFTDQQAGQSYWVHGYINDMLIDTEDISSLVGNVNVTLYAPTRSDIGLNLYYMNTSVPIQGATVDLLSHDNTPWRSGTTDSNGRVQWQTAPGGGGNYTRVMPAQEQGEFWQFRIRFQGQTYPIFAPANLQNMQPGQSYDLNHGIDVPGAPTLPVGKWTIISHGRMFNTTFDDKLTSWMVPLANRIRNLSSAPVNIYTLDPDNLEIMPINLEGTNNESHNVLLHNWRETSNIFLGSSHDGHAYAAGDKLHTAIKHNEITDSIFTLIGYSRGAVVVSEVARRLILDNRTFSQVIFLDGEGLEQYYSDNRFDAWESPNNIRWDNIYAQFTWFLDIDSYLGGHRRSRCHNLFVETAYNHITIKNLLIDHLSFDGSLFVINPVAAGLPNVWTPPTLPKLDPHNHSGEEDRYPEKPFDGKFSWNGNFAAKIAGWYGFGGGGQGSMDLAGRLRLATGQSRASNWFWMPESSESLTVAASALDYTLDGDFRVLLQRLSDGLTEVMLDFPLQQLPIHSSAIITIPPEFRGTAVQIILECIPGPMSTNGVLVSEIAVIDQGLPSAPPSIVQQPEPVLACSGDSVLLGVVATGPGSIQYQWYRHDQALPGETSSSLQLDNVSTNDAGIYRCAVSNAAGQIMSDGAEVALVAPPQIVSQPAGGSLCTLGTIVLDIVSQGNSLSYQWRQNGVPIAGANDAMYQFQGVDPGTYSFDCVVTDVCGQSVTSNQAVVTVSSGPSIQSQPQSQSACTGDAVTFAVTATGTAPLSYQWFKDGVPIPGAVSNSYTIPSVNTSHQGEYTCDVSNACSVNGTNAASLQVAPPLGVPTDVQASDSQVCAGEPVILTANTPSGQTIDWFDGACGGILVGSGSSVTVTPTQTTTYFARVRHLDTGCIGTDCVSVAVEVENCGAPAVSLTDDTGAVIQADHTYQFGSTVVGNPLTRTFTIENTGGDTLNLGSFQPLAPGLSVSGWPAGASVEPGDSVQFSLTLEADEPTMFVNTWDVVFEANDPSLQFGVFVFVLQADVNEPCPGELVLSIDGQTVSSSYFAGTWDLGDYALVVIDIENVGCQDLIDLDVDSDSAIVVLGSPSQTLGPNQASTFSVLLPTDQDGSFGGSVVITYQQQFDGGLYGVGLGIEWIVNPSSEAVFVGPSGGSWFDVDHWSTGAVPDHLTDVLIPSDTLVEVGQGDAQSALLTLEHGATVLVNHPLATLGVHQLEMIGANLLIENGFVESTSPLSLGCVGQYSTLLVDGLLRAPSIDLCGLGVLTGSGSIDSNVVNAGEVWTPTTENPLTILGNYIQHSDGLLLVTIDENSSGASSGLHINGTVSLSGGLWIELEPDLLPAFNDWYQLVATSSAYTGQFAWVQWPDLGDCRVERIDYSDPSVIRVAVGPCPSEILVPQDVELISDAISMIASGGEILVGPGVYNESIDFADGAFRLVSSDGASGTILDGTGLNGSIVRITGGQDESTVLRGFTVRNGQATMGGGLYILNSSPTIEHVVFQSNAASGMAGGGAAYIDGGDPVFLDCDFIENTAQFGGAINSLGGSPWIDRCRFIGNTAFRRGGAIAGGTDTQPNNMFLLNTVFIGNMVHPNPNIGNQRGGAISNVGDPTIINCSFALNQAPIVGGVWIVGSGSTASIANSILWSNTSDTSNLQGSQLDSAGNASILVNHSCIEGMDGSLGGVGNIALDPLFADDDLRLLPGSPSIDAGSNDEIPPGVLLDLDGLSRIVNDSVDMGAYELQVPSCPADLNGDGELNFFDIALFVLLFEDQDPIADFNNDGLFNFFDFSAYLSAFNAGCP